MANQDNLSVVQQAYGNFKSGNVQALLAQMDPAVVWQLPETAGSRVGGRREGRDKVQEFFTLLGTDQEVISFEPRQFVADGDMVVAIGQYEWRVKATGKTFKADFAHAFTIRNGKVTRFQEFAENAAAAEAYRA